MLSRIQLRQFLSVVDTGSFTRAANALNITQPSLSSGIAELERQLGTRLFIRERRRIRLTTAGNELLPLARSIERDFHEAESRVGNLPVPIRPLKVGVLDSLSTAWLEAIINQYRGEEPLELVEGGERELLAAIGNGSIDVALTLVRADDDCALYEEDYCLALPKSHVLADKARIAPEDVAGETMMARRSCEILADTSRFFTEHGVRPRFAMRSANDDRVMAAVRAGIGVTVAPRSLGGRGIAMVEIDGFSRKRTIGLLQGLHSKAGTAQLLRALRSTAPDGLSPLGDG
ncbi:LysR family transcriptional regulator [Novosphingobium sp. APW14]|uniref:LysR family transcriptional regulator n=1 Tax=Novosphingobium sp. APW14 TaxID=3077237 RepID=UPI0028DE4F46|nr:LysR family transcriptional regulator [Novosphingobium sp. APW14]MDT9012700.1 LysR family transcriptional regulator [Novosphingobium sp. APW14]